MTQAGTNDSQPRTFTGTVAGKALPPHPTPGVAKLVSLELLEAIIATISGENLLEGEAFAEET